MEDKPDLRDAISNNIVTGAAENFVKENSEKISASPLVQGFLIGYICARFPVGLFVSAGVGFLGGLYLEENFALPNLKDKLVSFLPEQKSKEK